MAWRRIGVSRGLHYVMADRNEHSVACPFSGRILFVGGQLDNGHDESKASKSMAMCGYYGRGGTTGSIKVQG